MCAAAGKTGVQKVSDALKKNKSGANDGTTANAPPQSDARDARSDDDEWHDE